MSEEKRPKRPLHVQRPKSIRVEALTHRDDDGDPDGIRIPCIKLRGMWLHVAGFRIGDVLIPHPIPGGIGLTVRPAPEVVTRQTVKRSP